jgi:peptide/nickel transport system permease protein
VVDLLWTDVCFLVLLSCLVVVVAFSLRKEQIRRALSSIVQRPLAVCATLVLLFFLFIGVLDSIHFKPSNNVADQAADSLLDRVLSPIGTIYEKTYSAPLALTSSVSETQMVEGLAQQIYPRLNYLPAALITNLERDTFIKKCITNALLLSCSIGLCLWGLKVGFFGLRHRALSFKLPVAGISLLLSLVVLIFFLDLGYSLSRSLHVLGTGQIGQDIFYFTLKSIRTGLVIGLLTTLFMMPFALFLGIAAGYFGGVVDDVIQYVYTTLSSIPGVLLITASVLSLQTYITNHPDQFTTLSQSADARLLALCFILGVTSWTSLCRLLRAETLKLREIDYVLAARALGSSWFTIIRKHLLPNVMHIVIITLVLDFSFLVLAEAVLSYVGVGVSPMTISWGNMINGARLELARDPIIWWPMFAAFLFMFLLVLAINLFADALRDAFDPHQ